MTLVKRNEDYSRFPSIFDDFFGKNYLNFTTKNYSNTNTTIPSVNILEDDNQFIVELAAPGFEKTDFTIEVTNNVLTIFSDKEVQNETKEGECYSRKEFSYQSFSRSFTLPNSVEEKRIGAKYDNGILKVNIPKRDEAKPKPAVQISIE